MAGNESGGGRVLGRLGLDDDTGVVRMEQRVDTGIEDVWSALTDPRRLAGWLGEVDGDLHLGGEFRARYFASGWEGTGRVEACDPPKRLLVLTADADTSEEHAIEAVLTTDGDGTVVVIEERGMPPDLLAAYGAGVQVHVEDLAAHLAGGDRCDADARWSELLPAYRELAAGLGQ